MNKTAIKNFAIWARNKLIDDITGKTRLLGITEKGISSPLPSSTKDIQFFDIGTKEPYSISGNEIKQREQLVKELEKRAQQDEYKTAYTNLVEEVAYTWFNRLIAIRFMEVNDYLPSRIRVLSSETKNKSEPDIVTNPFAADLDFTEDEKQKILQMKNENKLDDLFRMLFIKQCNALHYNLSELFEKINDYTELLLQVSFTDKDGVVYHLVHDIDEDDFNVEKEGQVEIIGWLYQFYNTEPKDETFKLLKKNVKITKERIPSATQLFTPDWIVRYMVENSLGKLWVEGHPNKELKKNWKYYLEEADQEEEVQKQLEEIRKEYSKLRPEDIKIMDPAMGSGHILVYAFDVLIQIYESQGYSPRDAAKSILENNLYGLDIDKRAYQLAYFAVLMKARQFNRRILDSGIKSNLYAFEESNGINRSHLKFFGADLRDMEKNTAQLQIEGLLDAFIDAKEYGSIINVENYDWKLLRRFISSIEDSGQISVETIGIEDTRHRLEKLICLGEVMAKKYDVVLTNPPYMGSKGMSGKLSEFVKKYYPDSKSDLFAVFIEKWNKMLMKNSFNAMVTMQSWMFLSSFGKMRKNVLDNLDIINLMHMENMVLGIAFGTAVTIYKNTRIMGYKGTFNHIKLTDIEIDGAPREFPIKRNRYSQVSNEVFSKIPGSPLAYWISTEILHCFSNYKRISDVSLPTSGTSTGDNDKFLRLWHEVEEKRITFYETNGKYTQNRWYPCNKGGAYRKWAGGGEYVIDWEDNGNRVKKFPGSYLRNVSKIFLPGLTWSKLGSGDFSIRYFPKGYVCESIGCCIFEKSEDINLILALLNTKIAAEMLRIINPSMGRQPGYLGAIPYSVPEKYKHNIKEIVKVNIALSYEDWNLFETSWDFKRQHLIYSTTIETAYNKFKKECEERFTQLKANEEELNRNFIDIYGLQGELTSDVKYKDVSVTRIYDNKKDIPTSMKGNSYVLTKQDVIKSFLSYAVGCMFGRYSLDVEGLAYAGGDWDTNKYKSFIPDKDNIIPITDEEYFKDDIVGLFTAFVKKVYGEETSEKNLSFIADALGNKGDGPREVIRNYFLNEFFKDHVKTYKKRPIYWLFDSGKKNGFKALVYLHRYDENTIGKLRVEYLHKMQRIYEGEIKRMGQTMEESTDSREVTLATKRQEKLIKQLQETREYDEKITHLALERISLDLDDGVKVNYEKLQTDREGKKHQVLAKI
jgi:type II restriction/modification system DNA methylase subunit YeeA